MRHLDNAKLSAFAAAASNGFTPGLSKREYFTLHILTAMITNNMVTEDRHADATEAARRAEALLIELERWE